MEGVLHILCKEPDETVRRLIEAMSGDSGVAVVALYGDGVSQIPVNWNRLVDDIFAHQKVICWE